VGAARGSGFQPRLVGAASSRDSLRVDDADELPVLRTLFLEFDVPIFFREQRMVAAKTDICARMKTRTTLTNDDVARNDFLATIDLDA
jgi:hypothetical protein